MNDYEELESIVKTMEKFAEASRLAGRSMSDFQREMMALRQSLDELKWLPPVPSPYVIEEAAELL